MTHSVKQALTALFFLPLAVLASEGGMSGSGDFGHARETLQIISQKLAEELLGLEDAELREILKEAPLLDQESPDEGTVISIDEVDASFISEVIRKVRFEPNKMNGARFLYWGEDSKGIYIEALQPFFTGTFGALPIEQLPAELVNEIRIRLLVEASHTWGYTNPQGRRFAAKVLAGLKGNPSGPTAPRASDNYAALDNRLLDLKLLLAKRQADLVAENETLKLKLARVKGGPSRVGEATAMTWIFGGFGGIVAAVDNKKWRNQQRANIRLEHGKETEGLRSEIYSLQSQIAVIERLLVTD